MLDTAGGEATACVRDRVSTARRRAEARGVAANADLAAADLEDAARLDPLARRLLLAELEGGRLSPRGVRRVRAVALTLADLAGREPPLDDEVVAAALGLRVELAHLLGSA